MSCIVYVTSLSGHKSRKEQIVFGPGMQMAYKIFIISISHSFLTVPHIFVRGVGKYDELSTQEKENMDFINDQFYIFCYYI